MPCFGDVSRCTSSMKQCRNRPPSDEALKEVQRQRRNSLAVLPSASFGSEADNVPRHHKDTPPEQLHERSAEHGSVNLDDVLAQVEDELARSYTTVMLQNLPQRATQKTLLAELESAGYSDMFDFCYVPIVFQTGRNLGYAFVNFRTHEVASHFLSSWNGRRLNDKDDSEPVVTMIAKMQGVSTLLSHGRSRKRISRVRNKGHRPFIAEDVIDSSSRWAGPESA
mmetsp:Transcript_11314/g.25284  ORF Transcript_11314/g.25284 Transcript_11314/m.25284 type:complete len:224 (+) Transcript_11314:105-776(+)